MNDLPRKGTQHSRIEREIPNDRLRREIDLHELAGKFTSRNRISVVDRKLHVIHPFTVSLKGLDQLHRLRIPKIDSPPPLGDHHRVSAIGSEIQVVWIIDRNARSISARERIDRREAVAVVVCHPERFHVIGRNDMLWELSRRKSSHSAVSLWVDHRDGRRA